ncbi:hypothetical protein KUTeg_004249 [Tegillarca granosa]|uniref:Condensin complex subunit 1 n=1 Tax=Tegillarca granosa TaxID=220873 RepID=A0ABQ9FPF2_TEGGR|nr:hypothetical protein KUTeg_004249 [Tegillarca granosa]
MFDANQDGCLKQMDPSQFIRMQSDLAAVLICIIKQTDLDNVTYTKCLDCMLTVMPDDLEEKVLDILVNDSEAFVRRSVTSLIVAVYPNNTIVSSKIKQLIYNVMLKNVDDFDWEVKLKTLEFWQLLIEEELKIYNDRKNCPLDSIPSYVSGLYQETSRRAKLQNKDELKTVISGIKKLQDIGCWEALCKLMEDYDQSVSEQTCKLVIRVRDFIKSKTELEDSFHSRPNAAIKQESEILNTHCDRFNNMKRKSDNQNGHNEHVSKVARMEKHEDQNSHYETELPDIVLKLFNETKLDLVLISCKSGDLSDEYDKNPLSLLEDILADLESQDQEDDGDNVVDCY